MVIKPTDFFDCDYFPSLVEATKTIGLFIFFEELFPVLLEEKIEVSNFLCALECYLRGRGFDDEVTGKMQEVCAEVLTIERQRKESKDRQNNGLS